MRKNTQTPQEKKFNSTLKKYDEWTRKVRDTAEEYLKTMLNDRPRIDLSEDNCITVSYDGGNHPEYASNCFSHVQAVFLNERGNVCLDIEDCSEYDIDDTTTDDIVSVCLAVKAELEEC